MNAEVLATSVADGIAAITLGSARRIYMDDEMGVALTDCGRKSEDIRERLSAHPA